MILYSVILAESYLIITRIDCSNKNAESVSSKFPLAFHESKFVVYFVYIHIIIDVINFR